MSRLHTIPVGEFGQVQTPGKVLGFVGPPAVGEVAHLVCTDEGSGSVVVIPDLEDVDLEGLRYLGSALVARPWDRVGDLTAMHAFEVTG